MLDFYSLISRKPSERLCSRWIRGVRRERRTVLCGGTAQITSVLKVFYTSKSAAWRGCRGSQATLLSQPAHHTHGHERCKPMSHTPQRTRPTRARRRCDNPNCDARLDWPDSARRPQLFCSSACRRRCCRSYENLMKTHVTLLARAVDQELGYSERRAVQSQIAELDWLLSSYPDHLRGEP